MEVQDPLKLQIVPRLYWEWRELRGLLLCREQGLMDSLSDAAGMRICSAIASLALQANELLAAVILKVIVDPEYAPSTTIERIRTKSAVGFRCAICGEIFGNYVDFIGNPGARPRQSIQAEQQHARMEREIIQQYKQAIVEGFDESLRGLFLEKSASVGNRQSHS